MTFFLVLLFALLIGVVAGLRAMTAPAVVAWAGALGWINLDGTWAQWVAHPITVAVLTAFWPGGVGTDQLPSTPSRRVPMYRGPAGAPAVSLARCWPPGGSRSDDLGHRGVYRCRLDRCRGFGTLGGAEARKRLVEPQWTTTSPVALVEDAIAIVGGFATVALAAVI
jgi:uncharacterized membrane protein